MSHLGSFLPGCVSYWSVWGWFVSNCLVLGWSGSVLGCLGSVPDRIRPVWLNFEGLGFFDQV